MAYQKTTWKNDDLPAINAENLNKIENGIEANDNTSTENKTNIGTPSNLNTSNKSNLVNAINEVNDKFNYSTTEKVIGTWKDGKPLYQKVVDFDATIQANKTIAIPHNIANAKTITIDYSNSFIEAHSGEENYLSYNLPLIGYAGNTTDKIYAYVDKTNINVYATGSWGNLWTKHITLNYTKTTD